MGGKVPKFVMLQFVIGGREASRTELLQVVRGFCAQRLQHAKAGVLRDEPLPLAGHSAESLNLFGILHAQLHERAHACIRTLAELTHGLVFIRRGRRGRP